MEGLMLKGESNRVITPEEREKMIWELTNVFCDMLVAMKLNPEHPHLKDTPKRMAKMYVNEV